MTLYVKLEVSQQPFLKQASPIPHSPVAVVCVVPAWVGGKLPDPAQYHNSEESNQICINSTKDAITNAQTDRTGHQIPVPSAVSQVQFCVRFLALDIFRCKYGH